MPVLEDGQKFERYQIVRWFGNGVAGESYEAEDKMLLRKVTLKLIHPWATLSDSSRRQFFREMQGISGLSHPYLASVLDYGESEGRLYVARRYASSGSLLGNNGRLWFRPPLSLASAFKYAHQLAQVLQYIHQHGYLHGSLTFANVLVLRGPNVEQEADHSPFLLADVGLANFVRRFGNPRIEALPVSAAPEQLGKRTTPASDQFALAALLYFWLAGRPPYLGSPDEVEQLKLTEKITPLSTLNPSVTAEQDSLILRALKVYPEERHASVLTFANALLTSLISPAPVKPSSSLPEQPETPREILTRPLSPLRKPPALRPAIEPAAQEEEAAQATTPALSNEHTPASIAEIPETPLPVESQELAAALKDALTPAPTAPQETPGEIDPTPVQSKTTRPLNADEPVEQSEPEALEGTPATPSEATPEEATRSLLEFASTSYTPAPLDEETVSLTAEAAISPSTELASQESAKIESQQPTDVSTLAPHLLISSPYTSRVQVYVLRNEETNVGRASASDLLLDHDNLTSRRHALFKRVGDHVLVFDKRSNNGIFVNGQQIARERGYELVDGDHISIGSYELIYRAVQIHNVENR